MRYGEEGGGERAKEKETRGEERRREKREGQRVAVQWR